MTSPEAASDQTTSGPAAHVDVLVVGGGITGIYQLYLAREAGFSVQLLEAGHGVGGTWYWNRYPGARFDSESYTYAYLFSRELFEDWEWREHFAEQPEIERYLNHVVDRFDLRRHMRFDARVTSAEYDERAALWTVTDDSGTVTRAHHFVAATGVLSIPYFPDVPGREEFEGESYHTGLWPAAPVDFTGKRVAVVGTGSSGVQIIPVIAETAASLTVLQRSEQRPHHARRAGTAPEGLRIDPRHAEHITERIPPRPARSCRLRRLGGGARRILRGDVEEPRLLEAHQQLQRCDVRRCCQRRLV
jgi:cation diffusion facilitator CzcD-associated flavoprotein CzcO